MRIARAIGSGRADKHRLVAFRVALFAIAFLGYEAARSTIPSNFAGPRHALTSLGVIAVAWAAGLRGGVAAATFVCLRDGFAGIAGASTESSLASFSAVASGIDIATTFFVGALVGWARDRERHLRAADSVLRDEEATYRQLFESNPQPMLVADFESSAILGANEAAASSYGYSIEEFLTLSLNDLQPLEAEEPALRDQGLPSERPTPAGNWRHRRKDGTMLVVEVAMRGVRFGGRGAWLVLISDVTERKRTEEALAYQASHDALTDLPNRALLLDRIDRGLASSRVNCRPMALLLIDLDRFKVINDTFGHHCGDLVLQEVNPRLRSALRSSDTVARMGGDEFAILLPETDRVGAIAVAQKVLNNLRRPIVVDGKELEVGASVGIALYPEQGGDTKTLMQRADVAMYSAKRAGLGHAVYSPHPETGDPHRQKLIGELREAFEGGQFVLQYQPKADFKTGWTQGCEALIRWQHPRDGLLAPGLFLPLALETGLIRPLSQWVLKSALLQCRLWHQEGLNLHVAVNLPRLALQDARLVDEIARLLEESDSLPPWLMVEVAEAELLDDPSRARRTLTRLRDLGVGVSIDDFGTRPTSFESMREFSVDEIKIDRSLIRPLRDDPRLGDDLRAIVELGHSLGLKVVAGGIENRATWELLAAIGCDLGQGFYLSHPLPPTRFVEWIRQPIPLVTSPGTLRATGPR